MIKFVIREYNTPAILKERYETNRDTNGNSIHVVFDDDGDDVEEFSREYYTTKLIRTIHFHS